jgi:gamma-glutamyltranspeptidase
MVASSQQLATLAGYKALSKGGSAIDATVAMVSTLNVVEPHSVGIGGDAFALIYLAKEDKIIGMNASGRAPCRANIAWFHDKGIKTMPERGILSVTVPGALHGWLQAVERYGNLKLGDLFEDARFFETRIWLGPIERLSGMALRPFMKARSVTPSLSSPGGIMVFFLQRISRPIRPPG